MIKIDASLFAKVAKFVPDFDERSYLEGVRIEPHHERGAIVVATNGHILAAMHDPDGVCDEPMILRCTDDFLAACKDGRRDSSSLKRAVLVESGQARVVFTRLDGTAVEDGEIYILPGCPSIEGKYPEWRKVISDEGLVRGMSSIVAANYLHKFAALAKKCYSPIEFWQRRDAAQSDVYAQSIVYVQIEGEPQFIGAIMPLTGGKGIKFPPSWLDTPQAEEAKAQS